MRCTVTQAAFFVGVGQDRHDLDDDERRELAELRVELRVDEVPTEGLRALVAAATGRAKPDYDRPPAPRSRRGGSRMLSSGTSSDCCDAHTDGGA